MHLICLHSFILECLTLSLHFTSLIGKLCYKIICILKKIDVYDKLESDVYRTLVFQQYFVGFLLFSH